MTKEEGKNVISQDERTVKAGTVPVGDREAQARTNKLLQAQEELSAEPVEELVEGEAPTGQDTAPQEGEPAAQGDQPEADGTERFIQALLDKLETKSKADRQTASEPEDIAFDQQIEQQKEEVQIEAQKQLTQVDQQLLDLQSKLESGDLEVNQYLVQADRLKESKYGIERNLDKQLMHFDNQIQRHHDQIEQQVRRDRETYAQGNPDFVERYNSGQIQEAMRDPKVRNVFGDNPAAVNEYLRAQTFAQENESLKAEIAKLKQTQQTAVAREADAAGSKVGKSAGVNQTKTTPQAGRGDPHAPYLALLEQIRGGTA